MGDHADIDHTGLPGVGGGGDVATDAIWTTAGMVAVATGTATATEQWPPGHEFSYVTFTDVTVTATTEGGAQTVVTSASVALDGSTDVYVEFYSPRANTGLTAGDGLVLDLYVDSTIQGRLAVILNPGSATPNFPIYLKSPKLTPSNASHTFTIKVWRIAHDGTVQGGAGGSGTNLPGYIRVVKG